MQQGVISQRTLAVNQVIRNTYLLLSMTLLTSAVTAGIAMAVGVSYVNPFIMLIVFIGMPFVIDRFRNSAWGLLLTFLFTGFMGYVLGPILNYYLALSNGSQIVAAAMTTTAAVFFSLSAYALTTRKDFSFMRGFLFAGLIVVLVAIVANLFMQIPALSLTISSVAVMLMAGLILFDTSRMIHDPHANYIMMTVSIYANIYVMFVHLLNLFGFFNQE